MTAAGRAPGALLVGQGPTGGAYHAAADGYAACSRAVPIAAPVPIGQTQARRWCQRLACRRRWQSETRPPVVAGDDAEHVCPTCYVERAAGVRPCPSCGSTYAAVPESAAA